MPKEVRNQLTALRVKTEKRPGRYADGNGLYLVVSEHGSRWWQWRGTVLGKRREIGMGSAYLVPLADARATASDWRVIARSGGDPAKERDAARRESITFEEAARHFWSDQIEGHARNAKHVASWLRSLETSAFPIIGSRDVAGITQADILAVLRPMWTDRAETAKRVRQRMKAILDWARVAGYCEGVNPVEGIERALPKQRAKAQHFKAVAYADLPDVYAKIIAVDGMGARALSLAILTATRSGEARLATWDEFDLKGRTWTIPAERMKMDKEHRVPLSDAAVELLESLPRTDDLVFPGQRPGKPLSDMSLVAVLRRLEIDAVVHGFRSTFRDWVSEETEVDPTVAEMALAHAIPNQVEAAYRRGDLFEKRRALMAKWANYAVSSCAKEK